MNRFFTLKSMAGVTIIELLIVLLIITIVMGFAVPQMNTVAQRQILISMADGMVEDVRVAQENARLGIQDGTADKVVAYQVVPVANGYAVNRLKESGLESQMLTNSFDEDTVIYISDWPDTVTDGFAFRLPTGRLTSRDSSTSIDENLTIELTHGSLSESIQIVIEPNGNVTRI